MESRQIDSAINELNKKYRKDRNRYDMRFSEWAELVNMAKVDPAEAVATSFDYGFMKGIRFAKAHL